MRNDNIMDWVQQLANNEDIDGRIATFAVLSLLRDIHSSVNTLAETVDALGDKVLVFSEEVASQRGRIENLERNLFCHIQETDRNTALMLAHLTSGAEVRIVNTSGGAAIERDANTGGGDFKAGGGD